MRIYVACLAAYNNCFLHGRWIEATADVDAMQEEINAMLAQSPVEDAEEWAIHDTEGLPDYIGEFSGLEPVAEFAALAEDYDWIDVLDLTDIVSDFGSVEAARDALEEDFCGIYDDFQEYATDIAFEMIEAIDADDFMKRYFDYRAYARDLAMEMHTIDLKSGQVAVFYA